MFHIGKLENFVKAYVLGYFPIIVGFLNFLMWDISPSYSHTPPHIRVYIGSKPIQSYQSAFDPT